ncbi:hypothetical protein N9060_00140 [Arenicella sp.]|nr:hypothetical protein [Arenicella sp.]
MKLISKKDISTSRSGMIMAAMMFLTCPVHAADSVQCKGLENGACTTQDTCSWVEGYERKDGITVNAFCRTKAKPKTTTAASQDSEDKAS